MYARFYRWASDRLGDEGVVAFITNRSFIDSRTFDGFRKTILSDFDEIVVLDLGGDYKRKDFAGGGNVFGIGTGVAINFLIRRSKNNNPAKLSYARLETTGTEDKLSCLNSIALDSADFKVIKPLPNGDWLSPETSFGPDALALADRRSKGKLGVAKSIFGLFTLGVVTNRDDWVYDTSDETLMSKVSTLKEVYDKEVEHYRNATKTERESFRFSEHTNWTRHLKNLARRSHQFEVESSRIVRAQFRPFSRKLLYFDSDLNEMQYRNREAFDPDMQGNAICFSTGQRGSFISLATGIVPSLDMFLPNACQSLPRYRYTKSGERINNITDWGLSKFIARYGKKGISKDAIFAYCYGVLHDPVYREKYALNLKREFPRIPLYPDFAKWVAWGEALMALHVGYEEVEPWAIERVETPAKRADGTHPKPVLKSQPEHGTVTVDADTQIAGIPPKAWTYRLGNRSAIDWVLDQHKEKKPRDPTIAAKFNTYRFADYKESMIELLAKVVRVSVETVEITNAMRSLDRSIKSAAPVA